MKKLLLKTVKIDHGDDFKELIKVGAPLELSYRKTIMGLLKTPKNPQAGASFEETAEAMPIWLKFRNLSEKATDIQLEDAEHTFVVDCLKNAQYAQRTVEVFNMVNDVIAAADLKPKEV